MSRRRITAYRAPSVGGSGYGFSKTITIDHTKAGSADTTDYPLLVSTTIAGLKTTANGGHVESGSGHDIAFFSDAGLTTMLDFEVESWDGTTGAIVAWVRVPTLSHSADTVLYLGYGNASVMASQQDAPGTWAGFAGVWHMTTNADSRSGITIVPPFGPLQTGPGMVNTGMTMSTSSEWAVSFGSPGLALTAAWTIEGWAKPTNFSGYRTILSKGDGSTRNYDLYFGTGTGEPTVVFTQGASNFKTVVGSSPGSTSAFNYVVGTYDGLTLRLYVDGAPSGTPLSVSGASDNWGNFIVGALDGNDPFLGTIDEVRVSGAARSASYVAATFNNVSSPSTFYTVT